MQSSPIAVRADNTKFAIIEPSALETVVDRCFKESQVIGVDDIFKYLVSWAEALLIKT